MRIELEHYRQLHVSYEELCVAGAFMGISCLYGVSDRLLKKGYESLYNRVTKITKEMEQKGLLLTEISGTVRMDTTLYKMLRCMGYAERMGRISYMLMESQGKVYIYQHDRDLVYLEQDGRGGCYLGQFNSIQELEQVLTNSVNDTVVREESFDNLPKVWFGALLFEKRIGFYEVLTDYVWTAGRSETAKEELLHGWKAICQLLCDDSLHKEMEE